MKHIVINTKSNKITAILPNNGWFEPQTGHDIVLCHWSLESDLKVGEVFPVETNRERIKEFSKHVSSLKDKK